jgi:hypothetical protein
LNTADKPRTYPKCPKGDWHEVVPFWLFTDSTTQPPRGVMCLFCDDAIATFDDVTEVHVKMKRILLGRAGVGSVGYIEPVSSDKRAKP